MTTDSIITFILLQNISRRVAGHTLTNVNNTMYLIGGYDSEDGCSTKVYVLELNSNLPWIELISSGDMFKGMLALFDCIGIYLMCFKLKA